MKKYRIQSVSFSLISFCMMVASCEDNGSIDNVITIKELNNSLDSSLKELEDRPKLIFDEFNNDISMRTLPNEAEMSAVEVSIDKEKRRTKYYVNGELSFDSIPENIDLVDIKKINVGDYIDSSGGVVK